MLSTLLLGQLAKRISLMSVGKKPTPVSHYVGFSIWLLIAGLYMSPRVCIPKKKKSAEKVRMGRHGAAIQEQEPL